MWGEAWGFRGGLHLGDVLLADHMLSWLDFLGGSGDKDATPLTAAIWLADISAGFPLTTVGLEVPIVRREAPGAWEDVVLSRVELLHAVEVPSQQIFAADFRHAREVVDFLKPLHVHDSFQ